MNPHKQYQRGLTVPELLVVVALLIAVVTGVFFLMARPYLGNPNAEIVERVREHIIVIESNFTAETGYPAITDQFGVVTSTVDQYGCVLSTLRHRTCYFDGNELVQYPSLADIIVPTEAQAETPRIPVVDTQGDVSDAVTYSSDGTRYRLRYVLAGNNQSCQLLNSYEVFAGASGYLGVTVCIYESS